jgi:hypothetical protein
VFQDLVEAMYLLDIYYVLGIVLQVRDTMSQSSLQP